MGEGSETTSFWLLIGCQALGDQFVQTCTEEQTEEEEEQAAALQGSPEVEGSYRDPPVNGGAALLWPSCQSYWWRWSKWAPPMSRWMISFTATQGESGGRTTRHLGEQLRDARVTRRAGR